MAKTDVQLPVMGPVIAETSYPKDKLLKSKQYVNRQDALTFLLKDGENYTFEQVDGLLDEFLKGKVN